MKRVTNQILIILLPLLTLTGCEVVEPDNEIYFFYMEHCPGCETYIMAENINEMISEISKKNRDTIGESYNIISDENALYMKALLEEKKMSEIAHAIPLLIINSDYYVGYDDIIERLTKLQVEGLP